MLQTDCIFVGKSEKMKNIVFYVVIFDVIHQVSAVTFDLLGRSDGTKDNFRETLTGKHAEANTSNGSAVFDKSQCSMFAKKKKKKKNI